MRGTTKTAGSNLEVHLKAQKRKQEEAEFYRSLAALASVCRFSLTTETVELYDRILSRMGYPVATLAIQKVFATRKATDPFPSVAELISLADHRPTDQSQAVEIADKIWLGIANYGYMGEKRAREALGPIASRVIAQIGWQSLCEATLSQATSVKAQIRESARAVLEAERRSYVESLLKGDERGRIGHQAGDHGLPEPEATGVLPRHPNRQDSGANQ